MMFTAVLPLSAPHTTGHPAALPQDLERRQADTRVTAAKPGAEAGDARSDRSTGQDTPRHAARGQEPATAPPTILQLKINTMLQEQQQRLAEEARAQTPAGTAPTEDPVDFGQILAALSPKPADPAEPEAPAPPPHSPVSTLYAAVSTPEAPEPALSKAV
ncbi:hypothetical protein [Marinovum sp.]|uniref:hypothetical protein n=1 Tax=Marinovum sp. TaxID=2024839 RepID=UPI002B268AD4|nr:hypothetical protein [Marinovum sp.]